MDQTPIEDIIVPKMKKPQDPNYKKKLELSYLKCLDELCNPCEDWKGILDDNKFNHNPNTGQNLTSYEFELDFPDNIEIPSVNHNYVFKRSHFYLQFSKHSSRIKRDLIKCWRNRGYYVSLNQENNKWKLNLSWRN